MKRTEKTFEYKVAQACHMYNLYTNPAVLRTDAEHRRCNKAARKVNAYIRRFLRYGIDYHEMSNGSLWVGRG